MQLTPPHRRPIEHAANGPLAGLTRRALLRRGALLVGGAALASLLEACTYSRPRPPSASVEGRAHKLVVLDVGNIDSPDAAPRKQVVTDFMAKNPDVTIDVRALPSNVQWDRVARTTVSAGEQVDLLNINGLFMRRLVRDHLLDDLSAHAQLAAPFGSVDPAFLAAQSDDPKHPFALAPRCTPVRST